MVQGACNRSPGFQFEISTNNNVSDPGRRMYHGGVQYNF